MKSRREIIGAGLATGSLSIPRFAFGQQRERIRVVGSLAPIPVDDPVYARNAGALWDALKDAGWVEGQNLKRIERGTPGPDPSKLRAAAKEILALAPDVISAITAPVVSVLQQETRTVPIVFGIVDNPVEQGFVASIAHPGGNITGFMQFEPSIGGKWLQSLKEIAPTVTRVAILSNPTSASVPELYRKSIDAAAHSFGVMVTPMPVTNDTEIQNSIASFAQEPNGGVIVPPDPFTVGHRAQINQALAASRMPALYAYDFVVKSGGLMSYGVDQVYQAQEQASYIDRILRGANPADLPVQTPKQYHVAINLTTAKALGLTIPPTLYAVADEVIE
jgi:putative tryptophan/tyrosine transport system substrate-binding protein